MNRPRKTNPPSNNGQPKKPSSGTGSLRAAILDDFSALRLPISGDDLDRALREAEGQGLSHLEFLRRVISEQARGRRERAIERRIREARFGEIKTLEDFHWQFNAPFIDRVQVEALATGEFVSRRDNWVMLGRSGIGKTHLVKGVGHRLCALGYTVRYATSAELLRDLTASLADQTLPQRLRYWSGFDLLILDEFGFDKLERAESPQAANLFYKVIDARHRQRSTALVTNIDFEAWGDYLGDPPLAMAFLDRVVDGALLMKIPTEAKSHRASRARRIEVPPSADESSSAPSGPSENSSPVQSSSKSVIAQTSGQRSAPKST
jgi:DNA replication protein DnaC